MEDQDMLTPKPGRPGRRESSTMAVPGDLWSEKSYGDFVLMADWRWVGDSQGMKERPIIGDDGRNTGETVEVEERDSGIYLRGSSKSQVNIWEWPAGSGEVWGYRTDESMSDEVRAASTPRSRADAPPVPGTASSSPCAANCSR